MVCSSIPVHVQRLRIGPEHADVSPPPAPNEPRCPGRRPDEAADGCAAMAYGGAGHMVLVQLMHVEELVHGG